MVFRTVLLLSIALAACQHASAPITAAPIGGGQAQSVSFPLRVSGARFVDAQERTFAWRGITAFRLAEMIATGREQDAAAYLDWAKREQFTVVRVLLMAKHLFALSPEAGRSALPRLLGMAKERGLAVEAVPLADTAEYSLDYAEHVRAIGQMALAHGNAFVEIANEPGHATQDTRLHDPAFVARLAGTVPEPVVVALGSAEYGEGYAAGDYATFHFSRGEKAWDHVLALAAGARRVAELKKPVVSDEPIGAGPDYLPGRRDNEPARFAAAAALTRLTGMEATFHYEGGLHARIPAGREAACLSAWRSGLALLEGVPLDGQFLAGNQAQSLEKVSARAVFARASAERAVILLVDPPADSALTLRDGWSAIRGVRGVQLIVAERRSR